MNEQKFEVVVKSDNCAISPELICGTLLDYMKNTKCTIVVNAKEIIKKDEK